MAGLAGHDLLAGGCLPRCRLPPKRGREADEAPGDAAEVHAPRAKRMQVATQMVAQLDALNLANAGAQQPPPAACLEPLPLSPVAAPPLPREAPGPAAHCNALAVWSPLALPFATGGTAPAVPPCDEMDDGMPQEPPSGLQAGLRLPAVDVLLRPGGLGLAPQRPQASAGALVVWAGQPNISSVVQRAAERCGLLPPPRAPSTPLPEPEDDDDAPMPRPAAPADSLMACGDEAPHEASSSQDVMALD